MKIKLMVDPGVYVRLAYPIRLWRGIRNALGSITKTRNTFFNVSQQFEFYLILLLLKLKVEI